MKAPQIDDVTVDVVPISTAVARVSSGRPTGEEEGFDALEAVSETLASHDPAETAAHLALQALEMLKARPGPPQRVQPKPAPSAKSRR